MAPHGVIQLLDSAQGHALQTWSLEHRDQVTIGRSEDNDVVVTDPYVSRAHAYLRLDPAGDGWHVISISRQQIVYQGRSQAELPLTDGTVFRLGPHGCYLRFGQLVEPGEDRQTLSFDARLMPVLALDVQKMQREVDAIVDGDYFQSLKDAAHLRRRQRMEAETNAPRAETRVDCYSHEDETRG